MVLRTTTALLARQYEIQYQVDAVFGPFIEYRMHPPVVDFIQFTFPHIDCLAADRKPDFIIRDNRQVNAM
jgi:hypothetical protein